MATYETLKSLLNNAVIEKSHEVFFQCFPALEILKETPQDARRPNKVF